MNGGMKKADEFRKEKGRITFFSFVNGDYLSCIYLNSKIKKLT